MKELTARQLEAASLIARGLTNRQVAAAMGCSKRGVQEHVQRIVKAWGLDHRMNIRVQLVVRYCAHYGFPEIGESGEPGA